MIKKTFDVYSAVVRPCKFALHIPLPFPAGAKGIPNLHEKVSTDYFLFTKTDPRLDKHKFVAMGARKNHLFKSEGVVDLRFVGRKAPQGEGAAALLLYL